MGRKRRNFETADDGLLLLEHWDVGSWKCLARTNCSHNICHVVEGSLVEKLLMYEF